MLIDWFTVGAQALNFVILVWLMRRFLYHPILQAIDARERRIAAEVADASAKTADAERERAEFQRKNEDFEQKRATLKKQATEEAKAERQRIIDEAREEAESLIAKRQATLRDQSQELRQAIGRQARQEVFAIARKALKDLAETSLEERMIEMFTRRLRELDGAEKERLSEALKTAPEPALVRSAFKMTMQQRVAIQAALNKTFSVEVQVCFEAASDLISGIELASNGQKLAWNIDGYLDSMETSVAELVGNAAHMDGRNKSDPMMVLEGEDQ